MSARRGRPTIHAERDAAILKAWASSETLKAIAARFGLTYGHINTIVSRERQKLRAQAACLPSP